MFPEVLDFVEPADVDLDQLVRIKVYLLEIDRSAVTRLGLKWPDAVNVAAGGRMTADLVPGIGPFSGTVALTTQLGAALNLLRQHGAGRILSNPTLVAKNGHAAMFHAGGSIPIPTVTQLGQTSVVWKPFGIRLNILPRVDAQQNFNLDLNVEVSDIDAANSVETGGGSIPGLRVRETKSVVDLALGESLVLAELVDRKEAKSVSVVPGLGSVPLLGELFRSRALDRRETEVYLIVTPTLVQPGTIDAKEAAEKQQRYRDAEPEIRPTWKE